MTERQKRFVDAYLQSPNASEAARQAGYSERTAYSIGERLLRNVEVQEAIQERNKELETSRIADLEECLSLLSQIIRGELVSERVRVTEAGIERYNVRPTIEERRRATETRLKALGAFSDNRAEYQLENSGSTAVMAFQAALRNFKPKRELQG